MLYVILSIHTLEVFPSESRAFAYTVTMSIGLLSGVGLPMVNEMNIALIIVIMLIFLTATVGLFFFVRETKLELTLRNFYSDIFPETYTKLTTPASAKKRSPNC
jgi:hypothetical protein